MKNIFMLTNKSERKIGGKRFSVILLLLCLSLFTVYGQGKKNIKGLVTDEKNEPLIGVSVVEVGTSNGTITDVDGKFEINVSSNSTLKFSYIGYNVLEKKIGTQTVMNVVLTEAASELDEVVVVGYGTVKKRDLTGSVTSVDSEKLLQSPALSAAEAIQGKVPGVLIQNTSWTPGATPSILIRGTRSIKAGNDPLYVVDGIPISTAPNLFAPGDIESIEVLKDASATAIYGSRGANGVIIISTKKGKKGKVQVDYNGYYGIQTIQNKLELMDGAEYAEYVREAYRAAGQYDSALPNMELDKTLPSFTGDDYTWQSIAMAYDENGNYDSSKVRSGALWWNEVERTGIVTDHQLGIRGGGDKMQFAFNTTYFKNEGIYKNQDYSRYTVKLSVDAEVTNWLKIGGQSHFSHSLQNRGSNFQDCWRVNPLGRLYDDDGVPTLMTSGGDSQWWNPLQYLEPNAVVNPLKINRFLGSYYGEIKLPLDGLKYRANIGIDFHSRQDYSFLSSNARQGNPNQAQIKELITVLCDQAEKGAGYVMPGYTHLQRAQPVTFGHQLMAYAWMLLRDLGRLQDATARMDAECPLGSGALAGTTYPLDRFYTAEQLGFAAPCGNSIDGVSDRDFCIELCSAMATCMMHLSRLSEEIILWCSWEFKFIELDDAFTTGSSIMPQKKNPDVTELIRGKTGRVYGDLNTLLVMMKGIPLAYDKDMQEDKEAVFDAVDTLELCLRTVTPMLATMTPLPANMRRAAAKGFINATDCADYLTKKGMPFRDAYKCTGTMVAACIREGKTLEELTMDEFKQYSNLFAEDVYTAIDLTTCCEGRTSYGGPTKASVLKQIELVKEKLA